MHLVRMRELFPKTLLKLIPELTNVGFNQWENIQKICKNSENLPQYVGTKISKIEEEMTEKINKTEKLLHIMISETDNDYSGPNHPGTVQCCNQTLQSQVQTTMVGTALQWGQVLLHSKIWMI